jgi:DNA-directed RNA polymerase subunit RPC12/RpoP
MNQGGGDYHQGGGGSAFPQASQGVKYVCGGKIECCSQKVSSNDVSFPDCGYQNTIKFNDPIRCQRCGYRIMYKMRTKRREFFFPFLSLAMSLIEYYLRSRSVLGEMTFSIHAGVHLVFCSPRQKSERQESQRFIARCIMKWVCMGDLRGYAAPLVWSEGSYGKHQGSY